MAIYYSLNITCYYNNVCMNILLIYRPIAYFTKSIFYKFAYRYKYLIKLKLYFQHIFYVFKIHLLNVLK